ncbi:hypothetical protein FACS189462_2150 [Spirochaetia bacterium]|nr:hypothetical protein FACS189462_2150 [Spirochaetia bacterium]
MSEGSAALLAGSGAARRLEAGEALMLDQDGRARDTPQTVMRSPKPLALLILSGSPPPVTMPVEFAWEGVNYSDGALTRIEISEDRGFKRIAHTLDGSRQGQGRIELRPGVWYWRAYPLDNDTAGTAAAASVINKLTIVSVPPTLPLSPEEGRDFRYRSQKPAVRFQWTASPDVSSYILEAADNPGFTNAVLRETIRGGSGTALSMTYSGLENGRWYWRITPDPGDDFGTVLAPSPVSSFTITQSKELAVPTLISPPGDAVISISEPRKDIYFSWQNEAEAGSYTLLVSAEAGLRNPIITRQATGNYYAYTADEIPLAEGRYYWGVSQTAIDGVVSTVSSPRSFTIRQWEPILRSTFPPDNYTAAGSQLQNIRFAWKTNISTPLRFQVSDTPDFTRLEIDEAAADGTFQGRSLRDGQWYWRVAAETGNLQTAVMGLRVLSSLPSPALTGPRTGPVVARAGTTTAFTWQGFLLQPVPYHPIGKTPLGRFVLPGDGSHRRDVHVLKGPGVINPEKPQKKKCSPQTENGDKVIKGVGRTKAECPDFFHSF